MGVCVHYGQQVRLSLKVSSVGLHVFALSIGKDRAQSCQRGVTAKNSIGAIKCGTNNAKEFNLRASENVKL